MAYREFQDSAGLTWAVWETYPSRPAVMDETWRGGWLTFRCDTNRRRLAPIPKGWEDAAPDRLELMCRAAEPVRQDASVLGDESAAR